jgi:hypothetical protein
MKLPTNHGTAYDEKGFMYVSIPLVSHPAAMKSIQRYRLVLYDLEIWPQITVVCRATFCFVILFQP